MAFTSSASAQRKGPVDPEARVYQLSGIAINKEKGDPLPFTSVHINHARRRTTANEDGFFSIPVVLGDTVYFSYVGYHPSKLIVRDYIHDYQGDKGSDYIYAIQYLEEDPIAIDTVRVTPFTSLSGQELKTAILNLPIPKNDPAAAARDNVNPALMAYFMKNLPADAADRQAATQQRYYMLYRQQNINATVPFFDPIAMGKFVNYLNTKSKQKKEKIYNYWPD